ncbi:helix-turn-helix domain-containing protein [Gracilimonas mengyeensis]|uniref:TolB amino-terminal domain-containing protein n=1 Tax=Gracilimonas mengyeensis TaxID=1302730 RepID=A0A521D3I5_9BACT|nr:helix-turn-helix domain-containing protein [Gracilimonas mengyeensis]SMO65611.1 TolB amino-terminal domain-containing protein [Gracilimonas mengyeensis]
MIDNKSIAILPFLNLSSDPENEYFSDGITEDIINALTRIQGLKVTARTSSFAFKGRHMDVRHIGNQLGVSTVLEGSVRKSKKRVRISAQLIQTTDGFQIWSGRFDRDIEDIFELQDEISLAIAEQIRENFGHLEIGEHLVDVPTQNIQAYNLYLKARYNHLRWDSVGIGNAMQFYPQCIEMDPGFSWPYFGAGYCHSMFGSWTPNMASLDLVADYIDRGFEIDEQSFLGYYSKATLEFWGHWNYREAEKQYLKSMTLNPSYTEAEEGLAELYTAIGWFDEAMDHTKHILQLDPLSPNHHFTKANIHYLQEDYESALASTEKALQIDPGFTHAITIKHLNLIKLKRKEALEVYLNNTLLTDSPRSCEMLYKLTHQPSDHGIKREDIDEVVNEEGFTITPWPLLLYAQFGDQDKAMKLLDGAVADKRGQFANFLSRPFLDNIRETDGFKALVTKTFEPSRLPNKRSGKELSNGSAQRKNEVDGRALMQTAEIDMALEKLDQLMQKDARYLDTGLSLRTLADEAGLHPNKLSWMLNDQVGVSFNDYVNNFRLECFKQKALDPANKNFTLLGLAFESGFNSKSTFNDYFKKKTGITPRKWLKEHK